MMDELIKEVCVTPSEAEYWDKELQEARPEELLEAFIHHVYPANHPGGAVLKIGFALGSDGGRIHVAGSWLRDLRRAKADAADAAD